MEADLPPSADYRLEFKRDRNFLYAYVSGESANVETSKRYWREVFDECRRGNHRRLLIDEDLKDLVSASAIFEIAEFIAENAPPGVKIAFVDRHPGHQDLNRFGNLVANNRGVNSEVFDTIDEARYWLLEN